MYYKKTCDVCGCHLSIECSAIDDIFEQWLFPVPRCSKHFEELKHPQVAVSNLSLSIQMQTHNEKFKEFIRMCKQKVPNIIVSDISVLWDTPSEIEANIQSALEHDKKIIVVWSVYSYHISVWHSDT